MKKLIILRGPSGTGKSTISSAIASMTTPVFETDRFFTYNHVYKFDISKLKNAHQWNQLEVERQMFHDVSLVIVANTFIAHWEMERYLELAEEYEYEVEIIKTPGPWDANVLFERNKHSVPLDVIERHINGYQPHPNETEWSDLSVFEE